MKGQQVYIHLQTSFLLYYVYLHYLVNGLELSTEVSNVVYVNNIKADKHPDMTIKEDISD